MVNDRGRFFFFFVCMKKQSMQNISHPLWIQASAWCLEASEWELTQYHLLPAELQAEEHLKRLNDSTKFAKEFFAQEETLRAISLSPDELCKITKTLHGAVVTKLQSQVMVLLLFSMLFSGNDALFQQMKIGFHKLYDRGAALEKALLSSAEDPKDNKATKDNVFG